MESLILAQDRNLQKKNKLPLGVSFEPPPEKGRV
jgi:hypothetical protein